jgi:hypothetical protein
MDIHMDAVQLFWEEGCNIIVGQSHFIKSVEDIPEIVVTTVPGITYGFAFCEASGPCLIRTEGNDEVLVKQAGECAGLVGAGHTFYLIIRDAFPINLLNGIKACQEVASIYAATANPLQVVVAETSQGRGIMGVIDGSSPAGGEGESPVCR